MHKSRSLTGLEGTCQPPWKQPRAQDRAAGDCRYHCRWLKPRKGRAMDVVTCNLSIDWPSGVLRVPSKSTVLPQSGQEQSDVRFLCRPRGGPLCPWPRCRVWVAAGGATPVATALQGWLPGKACRLLWSTCDKGAPDCQDSEHPAWKPVPSRPGEGHGAETEAGAAVV